MSWFNLLLLAVLFGNGNEFHVQPAPVQFHTMELGLGFSLLLPADVCPGCHTQTQCAVCIAHVDDSYIMGYLCPRCSAVVDFSLWDQFNLVYDATHQWRGMPFIVVYDKDRD